MEPNVPQNSLPNAPEASPHRNYKILIGVLVGLVVFLILVSLWLVRQNRKNSQANNTVVNNAVNVAASNASASNSANTENSSNNTSSSGNTPNPSTSNTTQNNSTNGSAPQVVSSSPASGSSVAESSVAAVSVTFDRVLDKSSTLSVTKESLPYHVGAGVTSFSGDKKTLVLAINSNSNSVYTIHYTACTGVNTNCSTGNISFTVGTAGRVPASENMR